MPELPEAETSRRQMEKALKGRKLKSVQPDLEDPIVYDQATPEEFRRAIEGARVTGSGRRGKYFWLELDRRPWPVFHLGMSGHVQVRKAGKTFVRAWSGRKEWPGGEKGPEGVLPWCRLRILADNGMEMAITDPRRFGRIRLSNDPLTEPPISKLGFDPLVDLPSARKLATLLARRRAPIKAVLLDQSLFAGVGNWIADETLFQSRLSPHRLASSLSLAETTRLRTKLLSIIRHAVKVGADYQRFPRTWLFHHRWGKAKGARTSAKQVIRHDTVGGRTTAWVPKLQK